MTAKLQNAEPLMAPDLRVKAMKEAYAGRGAARLAIGLAGCDSLGATMAYVCIRPYIHTSMHTYTHIYYTSQRQWQNIDCEIKYLMKFG